MFEWLANTELSVHDIDTQFAAFKSVLNLKDTKNTDVYADYYSRGSRNEIRRTITSAGNALRDAVQFKLPWWSRVRIAYRVYVYLPKEVIRYGTLMAQKDDTVAEKRVTGFKKTGAWTAHLVAPKKTEMLRYHLRDAMRETRRLRGTVPVTQPTVISTRQQLPAFPRLIPLGEAHDALLTQVSQKWHTMAKTAELIDDLYMLEKIAVDHLPELWRAYEPLREMDVVARTEGQAIVLEQLRALDIKLADMITRRTSGALERLHAHAGFIQEITRLPQQLQLEKQQG